MASEIKSVSFGILSDEDIEYLSVGVIDKPSLTENIGCIYDARMGSINQNVLCQTCNKNVWECPGHFGHIELNTPVILYHKPTVNMLRCFCLACSRIICLEGELQLNNIKGYDKVVSYLTKLGKMGTCAHCKTPHPEIKYSTVENVITAELKYKTNKTVKELTPEIIKGVFDNVIDSDVKLFGLDVNMFRPRNLVLTKFPVIPTSCRPKMYTPENTSDDDLSIALADIIKNNNVLVVEEPGSEKYVKACAAIKSKVLTYCDNSKGKAVHNTNHKPLTGIKERIDKKEGIMRKNLMGKRCDQTGRTVIGPDPTLKLTEVAIPNKMADTLTVPEYVNPHNIERLTKIVNTNGASVICHTNGSIKNVANALVKTHTHLRHGDKIKKKDGSIITITNCKMELDDDDMIQKDGLFVPIQQSTKRKLELQLGDRVERYLRDGDVVLINRQPTLHRNSMQAMKVKRKEGLTVRINLSQTYGFNADFDGDEMNVVVPQTMEGQVEMLELSLSDKMMLSAQTNKPMIIIVQDSLLGAYKMTNEVHEVDRGEFMDILFRATYDYDYTSRLERIRELRKEPGRFTTPMLFGFILPDDLFIDYEELKIEYGVVIEGCFKKENLGATRKSLIRVLCLDYGSKVASNFVDNIQFITNAWLEMTGFSIGVDDCFIPEESTAQIEDLISKSFMESDQAYRTTDNPHIRESRVHCSLNKTSDAGKRFAAEALMDTNNILTTVKAGSKGDYYNSSQISGIVGQQNLYGKRPSPTMDNNTRTLPHYPKHIPDTKRRYESRGFVSNSFFKGLNPQESFFHAMSGREGMINTAMGTSDSGYNQRKTVKIMEDLVVAYDGSVRGATGNIYQFSYGCSGFDPSKVTLVNEEQHPCDVRRLAKRFNSHSVQEPEALSEEVVSNICQRSIVERDIPEVIALAISEKHSSQLRHMLKDIKVCSDKVDSFIDKIVKTYNTSIITPGEAVGIQAAQSIGEKQTQLTLNTFHTAGKFQQTGVGRFQELLDVRKNVKVKTCTLYFTKKYDDPQDLRRDIGDSIVHTKLSDITYKKVAIIGEDKDRFILRYDLDHKKMFERRITPIKVSSVLVEKFSNCEFSPTSSGLEVVVEKIGEEQNELQFLDIATKEFEKATICGIEGIDAIYIDYSNEEWSVITSGSNLSKLLAMPAIDKKRIFCSNVWEVYDCLGLIAAKTMLFNELKKNIVGINPEHIQLLVDKMTFKGRPMPVTRYTMRTNDVGPLSKATFEESMDNIVSAALRTEVETNCGISAAIISGNRIKVGTGAFEVHIDHRTLMDLPRDPKQQFRQSKNTTVSGNQSNQFDFCSDFEQEDDEEDDGQDQDDEREDYQDEQDDQEGYEEEAAFEDDDVYDGGAADW